MPREEKAVVRGSGNLRKAANPAGARKVKPSLKAATPLSALRGRVCDGESPMTGLRWTLLIFLGLAPLSARAQQAEPAKPSNDVQLNSVQKLGQRVFQQRCGI